jgi:hypothetical protein
VRSAVSARSRRPVTPTLAGCLSRRPGTSGDRSARASRSSVGGRASQPRSRPQRTAARVASINAGTRSRAVASDARSSRSPSHANSPPTAGRSPRWSNSPPQRLGEESAPAHRREERPAVRLGAAPRRATLDLRVRHRSSSRTTGHAVPTRAYQSRHRRRQLPMRSPRRNKGPQTAGLLAVSG